MPSKNSLTFYLFNGEHYTTTPYGMSLTIGGLTFQTDLANVTFVIGLSNNYYGAPLDVYEVTSYNNLPLINGVKVDYLHWRLDDYSGTALSSDALPLIPLDLSKWQDNHFGIFGGLYPLPPEKNKLFQVTGHVTSVYIIPEPATFALLGIGGLLLKKRYCTSLLLAISGMIVV